MQRTPSRPRLTLLAGAVLLTTLAAACAGSSPDSGAEGGGDEIVVAVGGSEAQPGGAHVQTAEMWNEQHPDGPTVRVEVLPDEADQQRQQQVLELQAGADNFDVLAMDVIWTGEYALNGWVESLEDLRGEVEGKILEGPLESAQWEGELWALPVNSNAGLLFFRTDLVPEPPTTWPELKRIGLEAAQREGIAPFVAQGAQYEGMVVNFLEYFWGAGGEVFNEDHSQILFTQGDAAKTALEFMRSSLADGFYAPGFNTMRESEAQSEFQSGNAVFMRNWPSFYALTNNPDEGSQVIGKFDIAPLPTFTGEGTAASTGGYNFGVSKFSDNKEAAREYLLFASTDEEAQLNLGRNAVVPVLESVYDRLQDDRVMSVLSEVLPEAKARPPSPQWNAISEQIQRSVFPAYNGQKDVDTALSEIGGFLQTTIE